MAEIMVFESWPKIRVGIAWGFYTDGNSIDWGSLDNVTNFVVGCEWQLGVNDGKNRLPDEGTATITLRNTIPAGEFYKPFSPSDELSPYGALMRTNLPVMIQLYDENNTSWVTMWTGWTDKIIPHPMKSKGDNLTVIECVQGLMRLNSDEQFSYNIDIERPYAHEIINRIFELSDWRPPFETPPVVVGKSEVDSAVLTNGLSGLVAVDKGYRRYPNIGTEWGAGDGMRQALTDIVEAEQGYLLVDREGKLAFRNRAYFGTAYDSGATPEFSTTPYTGYPSLSNLAYVFDDQIANVFEVAYYPNNIGLYKEIWSGTESIAPNDSISFMARASRADGSNYTLQEVSEVIITATPVGTGVPIPFDRYLNYKVMPEGVEVSISNPLGQEVEISLTLSGKVNEKANASTLRLVDETKIVDTGRKILATYDNPLIPSRQAATGFGEYERLINRATYDYFTEMSITMQDYDGLETILGTTIGDIISVNDDQVDTTQIQVVLGEQFNWSPGRLDNTFILGQFYPTGALAIVDETEVA